MPEKSVISQILQTSTLLIHNLLSGPHKDYFISCEFFKTLVSFAFDFTEEDIVEAYLSFIKGITVNLSKDQLVLLLKKNNFSLFIGAMMFFNYKDNMIRTASRTVILKIIMRKGYLVNDEEINEYVIESGFVFSMSYSLERTVFEMDRDERSTEKLWNELVDYFYYINDIIGQDIRKMSEKVSFMVIRVLFPTLIGSLVNPFSKYSISSKLALHIIAKMCEVIKDKIILEHAVISLFQEEIPAALTEIIRCAPPNSPPERYLIETSASVPNPVYPIIKKKLKENSQEDSFYLLLIIQGIVHSPAVSKEVLTSIKVFPKHRTDLQNISEAPNNAILNDIFFILNNDKFQNFNELQVILHLIQELLFQNSSPLFGLNEILVKILIDLNAFTNKKDLNQAVVVSFKSTSQFIRNLNFSNKVPVPAKISQFAALRKLSNDSYVPLSQEVEDSFRVFFALYKFKLLLSSEVLPENLLNYEKPIKWKPGEYYQTKKQDCLTVKINDVKVFIPDNEFLLLFLEFVDNHASLTKIVAVQCWSDLKITPNYSHCSISVTAISSNTHYVLKVPFRENLDPIVNFFTKKIDDSIIIESRMIQSLFEDILNRIIS